MWEQDKDIPDWEFEVDEVSAGCYIVFGRSVYGHVVKAQGFDAERMLLDCKAAATQMIVIWTVEDVYKFVNILIAKAAEDSLPASQRLAAQLHEALNLGSSALEILGAIRLALLEKEMTVARLMGKSGQLTARQVSRFVSRAFSA
jgi:hypothetical protein